MGAFLRRMMVKQWVGETTNVRGTKFRVFTTGDDQYYYFDPLDRAGCSICRGFAVKKSELKRSIRPRAFGRRQPGSGRRTGT